jgi:two-component system response regulator HydG
MSDSPKSLTVAVVDDDATQRALLRQALEDSGYVVCEGADGAEAVELARSRLLDAMILDVRMPNMDGLEALEAIKSERTEIVVILLTAYMDLRDAVAAIKTGAHDYLEKPIDLDELVVAVDEALGVGRSTLPSSQAAALDLPENIVAESPAMRATFGEALRVAPTEATALILGPSGSGKEILARYIHEHSARRGKPFVAVNCAALPENLIESELFGHERGAFTGAVSLKKGRFEEASGGVLLLDEIGEMPLALQPKLLRVLEEKTVRRVGGTRDISVDARVIAATNRPLEDDAREGRFREDLLYRLNVFPLRIAPLCERGEDVLPLADLFLSEQGMRAKRFSPAAQRLLVDHPWPGNVRELRNAVIRSAIISHGSVILPEDLPDPIRKGTPPGRRPAPAGVLVGDMEEIQKQAILEALERTDGNKTRAAELLGISRRNLIYKLRSYGM